MIDFRIAHDIFNLISSFLKFHMEPHVIDIHENLCNILRGPRTKDLCTKAYKQFFVGLDFMNPAQVAHHVIYELSDDTVSLSQKENELWDYLKTQRIDKNVATVASTWEERITILKDKRVKKMCSQIGPIICTHLITPKRILDFGAGNGNIIRHLQRTYDLNATIEGYDVVADDPEGLVQIYDGKRIDKPDQYYDLSYALTVLHHTASPKHGVQELCRLTKDTIIVIETIPKYRTGIQFIDWCVCFTVDYLWRLVHQSNEPVPGNYKKVSEWIHLFEEQDWHLKQLHWYGSDQKLMTEHHTMMVFNRGKTY